MPYATVENNVKGAKTSAEIVSEALILGQVRDVIQPIVDKSGTLSSDFAPGIVAAKYRIAVQLPLKATLVDTYGRYLAANAVDKPDIWAQRDVVAAGGPRLRDRADRGVGQRHRHRALPRSPRARRDRRAGHPRLRQAVEPDDRRPPSRCRPTSRTASRG